MNYIQKHSEREGVAMIGVTGVVAVVYFFLEVLDCVNMNFLRKSSEAVSTVSV
jgi:hypothetical protein